MRMAERLDILEKLAGFQRRQFREDRLFGQESFALADVQQPLLATQGTFRYLRWQHHGQRDTGEALDGAAAQRRQKAHPLMHLVLDALFGQPESKTPVPKRVVTVRGPGGAGKSVFTRQLFAELLRMGLQPIRVRMQDIDLSRQLGGAGPPVLERLGMAAVTEFNSANEDSMLEYEGLLTGRIFTRGRKLRLSLQANSQFEATLSPFVLILDAWDEIGLVDDAKFQETLCEFLNALNAEVFAAGSKMARIVLTGRPTAALLSMDQRLIDDSTPVFTLRPLDPEALKGYFRAFARFRNNAHPGNDEPALPMCDPKLFVDLLNRYEGFWRSDKENDPVEILGLPLFAYLAIRTITQKLHDSLDSSVGANSVFEDQTTLLRDLIHQTCVQAGKHYSTDEVRDNPDSLHIRGPELRRMLQQTACVTSVHDQSGVISVDDWERRIELLTGSPPVVFGRSEQGNALASALLVSYLFNPQVPGRGGIEFIHKTLREYLFAEAFVEGLKTYGKSHEEEDELKIDNLAFDFEPACRLFELSRMLMRFLANHSLTPAMWQHFNELLRQEVLRARSSDRPVSLDAAALAACELPDSTLSAWEVVREDLALVWGWWANDNPLRVTGGGRPAKALDSLAEWIGLRGSPIPQSLQSAQSLLGYGLLRSCVLVHAALLPRGGALSFEKISESLQTAVEIGGNEFDPALSRLFRPDGVPGSVKRVASISNEGAPLVLRRADLRGADLERANLQEADLRRARLRKAKLRQAKLGSSRLQHADLREAHLELADLTKAHLERANLRKAHMDMAILVGARLEGADMFEACLRGADLFEANLSGANLHGANLQGAHLEAANLAGARIDHANLVGATGVGQDITTIVASHENAIGLPSSPNGGSV